MTEPKLKTGIDIYKNDIAGFWKFGVSIQHMDDETCLYVCLFKIVIRIGRFYK